MCFESNIFTSNYNTAYNQCKIQVLLDLNTEIMLTLLANVSLFTNTFKKKLFIQRLVLLNLHNNLKVALICFK